MFIDKKFYNIINSLIPCLAPGCSYQRPVSARVSLCAYGYIRCMWESVCQCWFHAACSVSFVSVSSSFHCEALMLLKWPFTMKVLMFQEKEHHENEKGEVSVQFRVIAAASQSKLFKSSDTLNVQGECVRARVCMCVHVCVCLWVHTIHVHVCLHLYVNKWAMPSTTAFMSSDLACLGLVLTHSHPWTGSSPIDSLLGLVYLPGHTWFQCL